VQGADTVQ